MILALFRMSKIYWRSFLHTYIISIDGSKFDLYYLYCLSMFQRTLLFKFCFVSKAGCKGKGFILNCQMFWEVFFQCPSFISKPLCAKGKEETAKGPRSANRTAKITTFIIMIQIKRKLFLLFCKARPTPLQHVKIKCCPSLGKRMQK